MSITATALLLLAIGAVLANAPFVSRRFFVFWYQPRKPVLFMFLELAAFYLVFVLIGMWLEPSTVTRQPLGFDFFVASLAQFLILATPGFAWRVLRRTSHDS